MKIHLLLKILSPRIKADYIKAGNGRVEVRAARQILECEQIADRLR